MNTRTLYKLVSVCPAPPGLRVAFAMEREDGTLGLWTRECYLVGLADETLRTFRPDDPKSRRHPHEAPAYIDKPFGETVVHLVLDDGYWNICEESDNYAGAYQSDQDPYTATGCLNLIEYGDRLVRPDGTRPPPTGSTGMSGRQQ